MIETCPYCEGRDIRRIPAIQNKKYNRICRKCTHIWTVEEEPMPNPVFKKGTKTVTTYRVPVELQKAIRFLHEWDRGLYVSKDKLLREIDPSLSLDESVALRNAICDAPEATPTSATVTILE